MKTSRLPWHYRRRLWLSRKAKCGCRLSVLPPFRAFGILPRCPLHGFSARYGFDWSEYDAKRAAQPAEREET